MPYNVGPLINVSFLLINSKFLILNCEIYVITEAKQIEAQITNSFILLVPSFRNLHI